MLEEKEKKWKEEEKRNFEQIQKKDEVKKEEIQPQKIETITGGKLSSQNLPVKPQKLYEYFDPGEHWCRPCNAVTKDFMGLLKHMQSRQHAGVHVY